ncbi:MAG: hypothetical protein IB618_03835 [Candidatus Pacearchaeota archaeon]|nr:MAG: hypothetical protein IB618_03835 [Candidatus Pacearchaeota archaeon]
MKLLKKIAPLAVACMLGLTSVGFAMAQDLATWRNNFPGTDTAIVFHRNADALAVVDLTAALGFAGDGGAAPTGEAHLIAAPGNDLNYGEDLFDVEDTLEARDLDVLLADGRYRESRGNTDNDVSYEQFIEFTNSTGTMDFLRNRETSNRPVNTYLYFDDAVVAYNYRLVFDNPVEFDSTDTGTIDEDFELTKLKMLGREYFIVDATAEDIGGGVMEIDSLTIMGGALKASQWEYSTETYTMGGKTYEVEVKIISDVGASVILVINGEETDKMVESDTYTLEDDTRVGVLDVVPNEGAEMSGEQAVGNDLVTFYLGAEKMDFEQGNEIEINGEPIDGSDVELQAGAAHEELAEINLELTPDDDIFLATGESWTDPILGRFKFTYQGLLSDTESFSLTTSGDDGILEFTNVAGDVLEIPFILDDTSNETYPGDDLATDIGAAINVTQDGNGPAAGPGGNLLIADGDGCTGGASVTECEGIYLLVVGTGGEARILEIDDIDIADETLDLKEISPGSTSWNDRDYSNPIVLGFATITLEVVNATNTTTATIINTCGTACEAGDFLTSLAGEIDLQFDTTNANAQLFTDDGTDLIGAEAWTLEDDGTGDMIIVPDSTSALAWDAEEKDSDYDVAIDAIDFGALFRFNTDDDDDLTWTYPEEEAIHKVYVSELLATIPELTPGYAGGAAIGAYDDELATVQDMNLIFAGGSGINSATADVLGLDYPTYGTEQAWIDATGVDALGKAMIYVMASPYAEGKYAMIVAGYEDLDTARAAKVLRESTPVISGDKILLDTATTTVTVIA